MIVMGAEQNFHQMRLLASALDWWREAGVDTLIGEAPRNWLVRDERADAAPQAAAAVQGRRPLAAPASPPVARPAATILPAMPDTLAAFEAWRMSDAAPDARWRGAKLGHSGSAASGLMVITDMPEREDRDGGVLLSGPAGRLFDRMLAAIGRDRASIYLAPMCIIRPPSGRVPAETDAILSAILLRHIRLVAPERVLILGSAPSRAVFGMDDDGPRGILRKLNPAGGVMKPIEAIASFHPRLLLERPAAKPEAWRDLLALTRNWAP